MNRRQLLGCALAIPAVSVAGMPEPNWAATNCVTLNVRTDIFNKVQVGRAVFSMGAYEDLLVKQKKKAWHEFMYEDEHWRIRVTNLMLDAGNFGVVVIVEGRLL